MTTDNRKYGGEDVYEGAAAIAGRFPDLFRILSILNGANSYYVRETLRERQEVPVDPDEVEDLFKGSSVPDMFKAMAAVEKVKPKVIPALRASRENTPVKYDTGDVEQLIKEVVNEVLIEDPRLAQQAGARDILYAYVEQNLYSGYGWNPETGVFTLPSQPEVLPVSGIDVNLATAVTNKVINRHGKELTIDPRSVLDEDKIKAIVGKEWQQGNIPTAMAFTMLGRENMEVLGWRATPELAWEENVEGYYDGISAADFENSKAWLDTVTGNYHSVKNNIIDEVPFGNRRDMAVALSDTSELIPMIGREKSIPMADAQAQEFLGGQPKSSIRTSVFTDWLSTYGGKPSLSKDELGADKYYGHKKTNTILREWFNGRIDELLADQASYYGRASDAGMTVPEYLVDTLEGEFINTMGEAGENYTGRVELEATGHRDNRWNNSVNELDKDFENALRNWAGEGGQSAWLDDEAVASASKYPLTKNRVHIVNWTQAREIYKNSGGDISSVIERGILKEGILNKNKKEFTRGDAKKQAENLLRRIADPVEWKDLSMTAQDAIIDEIIGTGGIDVDQVLGDMFAVEEGPYDVSITDEDPLEVGRRVRRGTLEQQKGAAIGITVAGFAHWDIEATEAGLTKEDKREAEEEARLAAEKRFNEILTKETPRKTFITNVARDMGLVDDDAPVDFLTNFMANVVPDMSLRITLSEATNIDELRTEVMGNFDQVSAADKNYEDYARQYGSQIPTVPGMNMAGGIQAEYRPSAKALMPDPVFDVSTIRPELREMAFDRPEFAQFLVDEMKDPAYMKEFSELARTRVDMDAVDETMRGIRDPITGEYAKDPVTGEALSRGIEGGDVFDIYGRKRPPPGTVTRVRDELQDKMEEARAAYEGAVKETDANQAFAKYQKLRDEYSRAPQPTADITGIGGPDARRALYELKTRPGMSTEEFFRSKLPGFEETYKKTGFFREEQERFEQERKREEATAEAQRRARLRRGGGGGGQAMAVFRQARV